MKANPIAAFKFKPFSKKQRQILNWWCDKSPVKDADGIIADGAIRSGKSLSMSLSFILWAMTSFDGQNFAMCGKTVGSFRRNVLASLKQMLNSRGYDVRDKRSDNLVIISDSVKENYFYIFGGKDERSQDLIQGVTLAGIYLDEVALMPESFVNQATARCSVNGSKMWFNCNPASPSHWFKTDWIDKADEKEMLYLHFLMDDNLSLSDKTKERYKRMYTGVFYNRFILGEWTLAEGLIYPMYENAIAEPPAGTPSQYVLSLDYGTQNPFAALLWAKYGDVWYAVKEYYYSGRDTGQQKTDEDYGNDIDAFTEGIGNEYAKLKVIVDPSAASFIALLRRKKKYHVIPADNSILDGIRETAMCLQNGNIKISPKCVNWKKEVMGYIWADYTGEDIPVKENDHCLTGDTLVMTENGEKPISELVGTSGKVWSFNTETGEAELKPYHDCRLTQKQAEIFEIELADGRKVKATAEHPMLTKRGWVMLKDLRSDDEIACIGGIKK